MLQDDPCSSASTLCPFINNTPESATQHKVNCNLEVAITAVKKVTIKNEIQLNQDWYSRHTPPSIAVECHCPWSHHQQIRPNQGASARPWGLRFHPFRQYNTNQQWKNSRVERTEGKTVWTGVDDPWDPGWVERSCVEFISYYYAFQ